MEDDIEKKIASLKTSEDIVNYIKESTFNSQDMMYRDLKIQDNVIMLVYNESLTSTAIISDFVIKSIRDFLNELYTDNKLNNIEDKLNKYIDSNLAVKENKATKHAKQDDELKGKLGRNKFCIDNLISVLQENISISKVKKLDLTQDDIFYYLYSGFTCIIYDGKILAVETRGSLDRSINVPINENTIRGPKDAFIENFQSNVGLIRKRIKSEQLVLEQEIAGRRSKNKIGLLYSKDIAKPELIDYIKTKLKNIDIDGIIDSNYIAELIRDSDKSNFPTIISTERPDLASFYILEGRAAIIVENSPFILIVPAFVTDFINNIEDYFQNSNNITFTKVIRYIAFFITLFMPAFYISLITFNQEAIPTPLLISFIAQRKGVPFPAFIEALLMIISFEILREGDYRVPTVASSTLSIVGALILGEAAVSAGIVSPIMIIVIAITTISGLLFSDINLANTLRKWRIIMLLFAGISGLIGIAIGSLLLITKLASTTSFTKPFTYPLAPVNKTTIFERIFRRKNIAHDTKRMKILTNNMTKQKIKGSGKL